MSDWSETDRERWRREDESARAWRRRGDGVLRYLARRPAESWVFFAAGLILGGLFL